MQTTIDIFAVSNISWMFLSFVFVILCCYLLLLSLQLMQNCRLNVVNGSSISNYPCHTKKLFLHLSRFILVKWNTPLHSRKQSFIFCYEAVYRPWEFSSKKSIYILDSSMHCWIIHVILFSFYLLIKINVALVFWRTMT